MESDRQVRDVSTPAIDPAVEREYNLRLRHPERGAVYERFSAASAALRHHETRYAALRYGESPNSLIDFFPAERAERAPLFMFIHGGYWRALDRRLFSFLARPWLDRGVHVALPGYELAPASSVRAIVAQIRAATRWLLRNADRLNIDTARIVVSGHSAGAQLGAVTLSETTDWTAAGFVGISGVYDLRPLLATTVNLDIRLDAAEARALSPQWRRADPRPRYLCAVGGAETDGFRRQSREYTLALQEQGCDAQLLEVPARTHFDVLDDLADADAPLFRGAHALLSARRAGSNE
ncbi:MAG: alpha/beta hydrolase [Caldimonas sp.]